MQFSYNADYNYLMLSAYKVDVKVFFEGGGVSHIDINGHEFDPSDDTLYGVYVKVWKGKPDTLGTPNFYSLQEIHDEAVNQYDGIVEEAEREGREESAHIRSLGRL